MSTQVLRGRIEPLGLIDVLSYLGRSRASGALNVTSDEEQKSIIISDGTIIFARSNQQQDRLGDMLLARGHINQEQYDKGTELIHEKGFRHGRALVEIGAISPKTLWQTIQEQVKGIASSIIPWTTGNFEFINKEIKRKESIALKWPIMDLVQDIVRNLDDSRLFKSRFPDMEEVYKIREGVSHEEIRLEPYEEYVLHFINGKNTVSFICRESDYGEAESLRVIYLLRSLGWIESRTLPENSTAAPMEDEIEVHPLITNFNKVFEFIHEYLADRIGKVGTNMLRKYFEESRVTHSQMFRGVLMLADGRLDPLALQMNLVNLKGSDQENAMYLDEAMNEYLNRGILAVKKVLGNNHEATVVEKIGEIV